MILLNVLSKHLLVLIFFFGRLTSSFVLRSPLPRLAPSKTFATSDSSSTPSEEEISSESIANFKNNFGKKSPATHGLGSSRSPPSHRKAAGISGSGSATIHVCTNCGAESVKWTGKCFTCNEWNTVQPVEVERGGGGDGGGRVEPKWARKGYQYGGGAGNGDDDIFDYEGASPLDRKRQRKPAGGGGRLGGGTGGAGNNWIASPSQQFGGERGARRFHSSYVPESLPTVAREDSMSRGRTKIPNNDELNAVLGGGFMSGSLTLIGGDPGVGKSTLMLQAAGELAIESSDGNGVARFAEVGIGMGQGKRLTKRSKIEYSDANPPPGPVLYVSGEENSWQIASRASRLGINDPSLYLLCDTDADSIADIIADGIGDDRRMPSLVVIDSVQTMRAENGGNSSPGGITQVKEVTSLFLRLAKYTQVPIVLIGHVTKAGDIAGPQVISHAVDTVLYLEGEVFGNDHSVRILRSQKNRFGSADECGVFEMNDLGSLVPVVDASELFLRQRETMRDVEGCAVVIAMEGSRPMAIEIQALVSFGGAGGGFVRRTVDGLKNNRVDLLLAVLQKRYGLSFSKREVFINVAGGINFKKTANGQGGEDVSVAVALVSSLAGIPARCDTCFCGEVGLAGEIRMVQSIEKRIAEAARMGFSRIVIPATFVNKGGSKGRGGGGGGSGGGGLLGRKGGKAFNSRDIEVVECGNILDAINAGLVRSLPKRQDRRSKIQLQSDQVKIERLEELGLDDEDDDCDE